MRIRWVVLPLLALFVGHQWVMPAIKQTHWYKINVEDDTYFYRMKVGLSYKGTPIDFDIVVGCGVRVSEDRYSGASIDVLGWYPFVYAKQIPDGHAVMVRTTVDGVGNDTGSGPCRGSTSESGGGYRDRYPAVSHDWLPIIVWYDHADDLSHGLAYVTQDAYEAPQAQLEFHGARIEPAKRVDFDRFMETAPRNLVPAYNAANLSSLDAPYFKNPADVPPAMVLNPRSAWPRTNRPACRGVERIRLDEAQRVKVHALWPSEHPRYWSVPPVDQPSLRLLLFSKAIFMRELFRFSEPDSIERKLHRPVVYPLSAGFTLDRLDKNTGLRGYTMDILIDDDNPQVGMMSCDAQTDDVLEQAVTGRIVIPADRLRKRVCRINRIVVPAPWGSCDGGDDAAWIAFENDEFAITSGDLPLIGL